MLDQMCATCFFVVRYGEEGEERYVCRRYPPSIQHIELAGYVRTRFQGNSGTDGYSQLDIKATDQVGISRASILFKTGPDLERMESEYPHVYYSGWCGEYKPS